MVEVSLRFEFSTTNNQVEYQTVIVWITLGMETGSEWIKLRINSQLVISQIRGKALVKYHLLQRNLILAAKNMARFKDFEIAYVPREENTCADVLAQLFSTGIPSVNHSFFQKTKKASSIEPLGKTQTFLDNISPTFLDDPDSTIY